MKKIFNVLTFLLVPISLGFLPQTVLAVCPVCTVAVVAGLGLSRWLGVDDTISGVWIGGVILSSSFWLVSWLTKQTWTKKLAGYQLTISVIVTMYLIVFLPLVWTKVIGHPFNTLWGIDKLVVGTTAGSLAFLLGLFMDQKLRQKTDGKARFPYQKVVLPVSGLILASLIFLLILKWH